MVTLYTDKSRYTYDYTRKLKDDLERIKNEIIGLEIKIEQIKELLQ
jgi:hypothetical protein